MGPLTAQFRLLFDQVVRGRHPGYRHWNVPVYVEETEAIH
jgi:hypothetical protein